MLARRIAFLTGVAFVGLATQAGAATTTWRASFQGSHTTNGTLTDTECYRVGGPSGDDRFPFTGTAQTSETATFRTLGSQRVQMSRFGSLPVGAGAFRDFRVEARVTRSSTLEGRSTPQGCRPNFRPEQPDCGTKTRVYAMQIRTNNNRRRNGLVVRFIRRFVLVNPDDPFRACYLVDEQDWLGSAKPVVAYVSAARLFNRGLRRLVVTGRLTGNPTFREGSISARSSHVSTLRITLTR
jgi:hypothetical protein